MPYWVATLHPRRQGRVWEIRERCSLFSFRKEKSFLFLCENIILYKNYIKKVLTKLYKCYIIILRNEGRKMKKEIIKNDRKWICEEKGSYYEVKYYEYSKICNVWTYVSKDNWSRELVKELERGE